MNAKTPNYGGGTPEKSSTGSKVMLVLLAIFGGIVLLCCGGGIFIYSQIQTETFDDPAVIAAVRDEIVQIDVSERFQPMAGAKINLFLYRSNIAIYQREGGVSQIAVVSVDVRYGKSDLNEAREQMKNQGALPTDLKDSKIETRTYDIDGSEIEVLFSHGTLKDDSAVFERAGSRDDTPRPGAVPKEYAGKAWYAVQAMIPRGEGLVVFIATGPEDEFDESEIDTMIRSIHLNATDDDAS